MQAPHYNHLELVGVRFIDECTGLKDFVLGSGNRPSCESSRYLGWICKEGVSDVPRHWLHESFGQSSVIHRKIEHGM